MRKLLILAIIVLINLTTVNVQFTSCQGFANGSAVSSWMGWAATS